MMMADDDMNLPQTQSQPSSEDQIFSQTVDSSPEVWGLLTAKSSSFRNVELTSESFTVGRATNCEYSLQAPDIKQKYLVQMSKRHFQITRDLSEVETPVYIEDLSRNGTFINEEKIGFQKKRILASGDIIAISHPKLHMFSFRDYRSSTPRVKLPKEVAKKYFLGKELGKGACGTVYLVHEYRTCNTFALKQIEQKQILDCKNDKSLNEARIMKSLTHPCIVKMYDIIVSPNHTVYITLELMKGGELLTRIQNQKFLSEANSKFFFYQMCYAIKYLHDRNITHRDLKPDNILLASEEENTLLKISDFGLSKLVKNNSVLRTLCGTPLYVAPEVLYSNGKGEYTKKVDIWSLGVVLFTMLSGTLPFADDYGSPATEQIKKGKFQFRSSNWLKVSSTAKGLIRHLLTTDVEKRPSIEQLLRHKWLADYKMISTVHKIMQLPMPRHCETHATRMALNVPSCHAEANSVFARPYEVNVDSENVQSSKRRRLR